MPKDTISAIMSRWSCRDFIGQTPSDADLKTIAEAALASPSGMNRQHWRVVVVKNKGLIEEMDAEGMNVIASLPDKSMHERIMGRGGKLFYGAPVMIVLPVKEASPQGAELMDCGIVAENIAIAAAGLGIDSVICGLAAFTFAGS
ncbi:MAG: nitroreductase family protein, partial [Clostridiales Family XIII bacterium]|nr:nitroreductase family protein [Clostridiales Family XIII bacterium]